jgi:hypothetical protein
VSHDLNIEDERRIADQLAQLECSEVVALHASPNHEARPPRIVIVDRPRLPASPLALMTLMAGSVMAGLPDSIGPVYTLQPSPPMPKFDLGGYAPCVRGRNRERKAGEPFQDSKGQWFQRIKGGIRKIQPPSAALSEEQKEENGPE